MQSFPDREENGFDYDDVVTVPQTADDEKVPVDGAAVDDHADDRREHLEYDVIGTDDADGGTGSKMTMKEGSYLGRILLIAN
jgi:hypothetical protein